MSNKPIYHPHISNVRVAYRCNGLWVLQVREPSAEPNKFVDPWKDQHTPKDSKDDALRIMYERFPSNAKEASNG